MGFTVGGTKKGGMPVTVEKRPRGKTVTVIGNVKGDKDELIKLLKHSLGCGGHAVGPMVVEIQGDHHDAIQALLLKHGGTDTMKGVAGLKKRKEEEDTTKTSQQDDEYIDSRDLLKTQLSLILIKMTLLCLQLIRPPLLLQLTNGKATEMAQA